MPRFSLPRWSSTVFVLPALSTLHLSLTSGFITKALVSMVSQISQFLLMPCFIFIFFIAHWILSPVNDSFVCFCIRNKQQRVTTASHLLRQVDSPTANTRTNKVYVRLSLQNNPIVGLAHEEL